MIRPDDRFTRADAVVAQEASGTLVLLHLDSGAYFALNEVGARVWELCDGGRTAGEIASAVAQQYDAPAAEVSGDVSELLEELVREKLVA